MTTRLGNGRALLLGDGLFNLGPFQLQHPLDFIRADVALDETADLFQAKTQVAQSQDAVERRQLVHDVVAVAVVGIDVIGFEQAQRPGQFAQ